MAESVNRLLVNIVSNKLSETRDFYCSLFQFKVDYDSDWFVHLISKGRDLELGIIKSGHEIVPAGISGSPAGFYITLVVDNADAVFSQAQNAGFTIEQPPHDTFYGQRRLLLKDPNGTTVDVSSPI